MCEIIKKKLWSGIPPIAKFNLSKICSQNCLFFRLFLLVWVIKRFLEKQYGVTGLVFKIDAIAGRKWVKFVAMQHNNIFLEVT